MSRVYNFSAGPSCLPEEALAEAAAELLEYGNSGQSVMEMSHRSKDYGAIIHETEALLRELLAVGEDYAVLFMQGGASLQFACVPLNLTVCGKAAYVDTGVWADKAAQEAGRYTSVTVAASSKDTNYTRIPQVPPLEGDWDYLHITLNNTILGTAWREGLPGCGAVPLVADASSCILSEPLDVHKFGLIYAGAQKNLGPAGAAVVLIRRDLLERTPAASTPVMLRYRTYSENESMYNTPPCYTIYMIGKVLKWVKRNGGALGMKKRNEAKAALLYSYLDSSPFYRAPA
ncbi:MAG: 3-phosphoserine/phosphohydroxythreonine transaminase, partial [Spirochaetaceae bacterium]|nr:3-phosphoserine/phosphohydroxythreonine transaminase [Spirochaetaceae bacterium]